MPFAAGLVLGGFLSAVFGGAGRRTWALGMFDEVIGFGPAGKLAWMFAGGVSSASAHASPAAARAATASSGCRISSGRRSSARSPSWPGASSPPSFVYRVVFGGG